MYFIAQDTKNIYFPELQNRWYPSPLFESIVCRSGTVLSGTPDTAEGSVINFQGSFLLQHTFGG